MDMSNKINKVLTDQGATVVQKKPGFGGRAPLFGYLPQATFSAVNVVTSFDNTVDWFDFTEKQAIAQVTVTIDSVSHCQFGEARIVGDDRGSAIKGACTDAIQKALALFGIGDQAYLGKLEAVFNGKTSHTVIEGNPLLDAAKAVPNKETGRTWWRENLAEIKQLGQEARGELVRELEGKKK